MATPQKSRIHYLFYLIAFLIPLVFFVLLEVGLRLAGYGEDLSLFTAPPKAIGNEDYWGTNPNVANRYFPKGYLTPMPPEEYFLQNKPDNGYRVFVLGGSTAASWPYPRNVLFSRILGQRLSDAFPDKHIEVVNTGIAAVNTFTLIDFIDEVLAQQPDAILIYTGHNEFYGALGAGSTQKVGQARWMIKAYLRLSKLKTFQLIRKLVDDITFAVASGEAGTASGHSTLMGQMVGDNSIALGSETYLNARHNFEANLSEILSKIKAAGVDVMISELVSNLKDHPPFISVDDGYHLPAGLIYEWAKQLDEQGMHDMARQTYSWAKDQDGLRFRASEEFNQSIDKIAAQYGVPVVPMKSYFENASPNGIVGKELMLEHLHPNADGYSLMSDAFFHTLKQEGFVSQDWDDSILKPDQYYRQNWPITELDRALGDIRIINLTDNFPYKPKGPGERSIANYQARDIVEELAFKTFKREIGYVEAHVTLAKYYESNKQYDLALREFQALIRSEPFNVDFYLLASEFLLKHKQFERALPILQDSLKIKETGYAYKWIGQILLIMRRAEEAHKYLETALSYAPDDAQIIYNLGFVYLVTNQIENAQSSIKQLEKIAPESKGLKSLNKQLNEYLGAGRNAGAAP